MELLQEVLAHLDRVIKVAIHREQALQILVRLEAVALVRLVLIFREVQVQVMVA